MSCGIHDAPHTSWPPLSSNVVLAPTQAISSKAPPASVSGRSSPQSLSLPRNSDGLIEIHVAEIRVAKPSQHLDGSHPSASAEARGAARATPESLAQIKTNAFFHEARRFESRTWRAICGRPGVQTPHGGSPQPPNLLHGLCCRPMEAACRNSG